MKHISIDFHFIRDLVSKGLLQVSPVKTKSIYNYVPHQAKNQCQKNIDLHCFFRVTFSGKIKKIQTERASKIPIFEKKKIQQEKKCRSKNEHNEVYNELLKYPFSEIPSH